MLLSYLKVQVFGVISTFVSSNVVSFESAGNGAFRRLFDDCDAGDVCVGAGGLDFIYALSKLTVLLATALGLGDALCLVSFQLLVIDGDRATSLLVGWQRSVERSGSWLGWGPQCSSLWVYCSGL